MNARHTQIRFTLADDIAGAPAGQLWNASPRPEAVNRALGEQSSKVLTNHGVGLSQCVARKPHDEHIQPCAATKGRYKSARVLRPHRFHEEARPARRDAAKCDQRRGQGRLDEEGACSANRPPRRERLTDALFVSRARLQQEPVAESPTSANWDAQQAEWDHWEARVEQADASSQASSALMLIASLALIALFTAWIFFPAPVAAPLPPPKPAFRLASSIAMLRERVARAEIDFMDWEF